MLLRSVRFAAPVAVLLLVTAASAINSSGSAPPAPPAFPDSDFDAMQQRIVNALDRWTGNQSVWNWIDLLSDNATVCYPFTGIFDAESCYFGKRAVELAIGYHDMCNFTDIQQNSYWLTKTATRTVGAWQYTTSEGYVYPGGLCIIQYSGNVLWELDAANPKKLSKWLEMPDSTRIERTSSCTHKKPQQPLFTKFGLSLQ